ncbi:hypothetical protein [Alteromonas mediterranea]|uniref:Uncharacterized protein n=1 Tax=Alteromonas mediterranea TaxID=314275 RepID=A0AAC9ACM9_9ALTE|nr:hypothetical protein [Alteromonas mediterranea]AGP96116.1 hypothetical protein I635_02855 [Alteromonas mediterranea UM7]AGQ00450.1 hypothetical protein I636_02880 [Alteromonas mediterranea UM4b]AMJ77316.1 hypothetical protein AV942_02800 [Alteromonas mediterranea]AMJ81458.1 hypothetical protein AV941_02795 [Alteromonas mediterranea]HBL22051.1 hypothetical protein [Alteromonas mediterranea]|tara:strand:- start:58 stop:447 length:390 start_codon:yes stop_codon:yes gene_type:complete
MRAIFWFITAIIIVLSFVCSGHNSENESDGIFLVGLGSWAPVVLAFVFHNLEKKAKLLLYATACSFLAVSAFALFYLGLLALHVLETGSLGPSGMILAFFPFAYIGLALAGAALGLCMYLTERMIKKYA